MLALLDLVVGKKLFAVPLESRFLRLIWTGAVKVFVRILFVASLNTVLKLRNKGAVLVQIAPLLNSQPRNLNQSIGYSGISGWPII